jgi:Rad3-related DNA helicase/serine/threonine protein kinase
MAEVELQQIGQYSVTELLRASSTSTFYRGKQRKKDILIQRLATPLQTTAAKEAFLTRAKQLKKLKNRNIINITDANFDGDYGYLVMEYVEGETLRQRIAPGTQIAPDVVRLYLSHVAGALHYAHVSNILHSNLHPGNLIYGPYASVIVTEFALLQPELDDETFAIPYMAPEQLRGQSSSASDQYALAVMAYEWLTGRRPYEATERDLLLEQQTKGSFPPLRELNPAISPSIENVVARALAYDPAERYPHVQDFSDHYLSALAGFLVRPTTPLGSRTNLPATPVSTNGSIASKPQSAEPKKESRQSSDTPHIPIQVPAPETPDSEPPIVAKKPTYKVERRLVASNMISKESQTVEETPPDTSHPILSAGTDLSCPEERPVGRRGHDKSVPAEIPEEEISEVEPSSIKQTTFSTTGDARLLRTIDTDLRQGGVLSQSLPGYEERLAQIEMAKVVARALTERTPAVVEAGTGTGKALDVDTPIPTPTGWKRMGDLVAGDVVFDEKGNRTRVTTAFDIMYNRPCYEVEFSDGSSLIADAEHEWVSYTCSDRKWASLPKTKIYKAKNFVTLEQLAMLDKLIALTQDGDTLSVAGAEALIGGHHWSIHRASRELEPASTKGRSIFYPREALLTTTRDRLKRDPSEQRRDGRAYTLVTTEQMAATLTAGAARRANHAIAAASPLNLPDADLPIEPYFLGVWLGDGRSYSNQITTADPDLIPEIEKDSYTVRSLKSKPYQYAVDDENGKSKSRWQPGMTGRLRTLGLRLNKHIPAIYLRASEQQRRALLAGLLDTDGTVNRCGAVEFTTTSPQLAQDVYELVCSLGFRPTLRPGQARLKGKDCGPKWTLAFTTDQGVFRLEHKIKAQKERLLNYSPERNSFRYVTAVKEVPSRPVRCIQVKAKSHLYLAGRSMIPTHNSLAYLVPVVRSGKVGIISTANKALQEQLYYKDIPFVQKYIKQFEAALVKGMNNYVCLDRVEGERVGMQYFTKNQDFKRLLDIVNDPESTFTGDFETLGFRLPADIRGRVATDSDQCAWSKCSFFGECYVREMRENAQMAQIIVVNHTLLLLDAAMDGFLLPDRDVIVIDEAHHLEEEATRSFTITISPIQIQTLLAQRMLKDHSQLSLQDEALRAAQSMWVRMEQIIDLGYKGRMNLEEPLQEGLHLATVVGDLADSLRKQRPKDMPDKEGQLYDKLLKRTQNLSENIRIVFGVSQPDKFVYYVDRVESGSSRCGFQLQASAAPLDVTRWLQERIFNKCNVICTSATLATVGPNPVNPADKGPNFAYFRKRVGLEPENYPEVLERILPLAFDYESNALLYLPRHLPPPAYGNGSDDYMKAIAREMYRLVKISRGRAFLLFSSKRMLDRAYELMEPHLDFPLLKQGDMTRLELTRRFRKEEGAVLFGLKSFWEGVDIAGDALSLVVIDKLPFAPPDDPVQEARVERMKAAGENWFGTYVLPQAVLQLKQGLGRLLRTREDRGVMAILDTRLHTKGYGKMVLNALPPARRSSNIHDVEQFFT